MLLLRPKTHALQAIAQDGKDSAQSVEFTPASGKETYVICASVSFAATITGACGLTVCMMQASAPAPPPLLQCVASFAVSNKLAPLLAEQPGLLEATISVLAAPHASAASRDASLAVLESLLDQEQPLQEAVLRQHTVHLLQSLQALVTAAAGSKGSALPRALKAKPKVLLTIAHSCASHSHQQHRVLWRSECASLTVRACSKRYALCR